MVSLSDFEGSPMTSSTIATTTAAIRYDVEVSPVREVSLVAEADWEFWRRKLEPQGVTPAKVDGRAELMVCGASARFKGIRFRELSFSVAVCREPGGPARDAMVLVRAFNSIRFFAWVERTFFRTPYYAGDVTVEVGPPAKNGLTLGGVAIWRAEMKGNAERKPLRTGDDGWEGPILLPRLRPTDEPKMFRAKIAGLTRVYGFSTADDVIRIEPSSEHGVFADLIASDFRGREWHVREAAFHGKAKTERREFP
jgi:hypothetical protein